MADTNAPITASDLFSAYAGSLIRHAATGAAGWLAAKGALQTGQTSQFIDIASSIAIFAVAQGWSLAQKFYAHVRVVGLHQALADVMQAQKSQTKGS